MEYIKKSEIKELKKPGVVSKQLITPLNSDSGSITVTEVHLSVGSAQSRHTHEGQEQVWYALRGEGQLLLEDGEQKRFVKGDVVRFDAGEVHGVYNSSDEELVYISVTSPPIDFSPAYENAEIYPWGDTKQEWIKNDLIKKRKDDNDE